MNGARPTRALAALALTLAIAPAGSAQTPRLAPYGESDPLAPAAFVSAPPREDPLEVARRRFEALDPRQRQQLRARYERFRSLPPAARRELAERLGRLEKARRRVRRFLPPELSERLDTLPAEQRESVLQDIVESHLIEKGQRLSRKLPMSFRERLAGADTAERLRFFAEFKDNTRQRLSRAALRFLGRRLHLSGEDLERLETLPLEVQVQRALELRQRLARRHAQDGGLPEGLTVEAWERIAQLPPEEFHEAFERLRAEQPARRNRRGGGEGSGRETSTPIEKRRAIAAELREALHIDPALWVENAARPRRERRDLVYGSRAERVLALVEQRALLPPQQIERWRHRHPVAIVRWAADLADAIESGEVPLPADGTDEAGASGGGGAPGEAPAGGAAAAPARKGGRASSPGANRRGGKQPVDASAAKRGPQAPGGAGAPGRPGERRTRKSGREAGKNPGARAGKQPRKQPGRKPGIPSGKKGAKKPGQKPGKKAGKNGGRRTAVLLESDAQGERTGRPRGFWPAGV